MQKGRRGSKGEGRRGSQGPAGCLCGFGSARTPDAPLSDSQRSPLASPGEEMPAPAGRLGARRAVWRASGWPASSRASPAVPFLRAAGESGDEKPVSFKAQASRCPRPLPAPLPAGLVLQLQTLGAQPASPPATALRCSARPHPPRPGVRGGVGVQAGPWRPAPPHLKFSGSVAASLLRTRGAERLELLWRMANFSARPPYTRGFAGSGFFHLGENCRPSCWADVASHGPSMNSVVPDFHSFSENEASPPKTLGLRERAPQLQPGPGGRCVRSGLPAAPTALGLGAQGLWGPRRRHPGRKGSGPCQQGTGGARCTVGA